MTNRVALITDVLHFIGASSAEALAEDGFTVYCHDEAFSDPAERAAFGAAHPRLRPLAEQSPQDLIAAVQAAEGRLDALVHNDAYPAERAKIEDADVDAFRTALDRLVVRAFALTSAAVPMMKAAGAGKIVFVTSAAPLRGLANYSMYVTARGAANALARTLSLELARDNIQVNALAPNFVESPTYFPPSLMDNPETAQKVLKNIPLGRLGKQEEAAATVAFLCSSKADFITGHIIPLAGGWA